MKKLVLLFIVMTITIVKMAAQEANVSATGLHFVKEVKDKQWKNHHTDKYSDATYKAFTGQVYFTLMPDKTVELNLIYEIAVKEGKLEMEVTDPDGNILLEYTFYESKKNTEALSLMANKEYKVKFTGKQATGSYKCQWKIKQ